MNHENFNTILDFINEIESKSITYPQSIKIRFLRNFTIEPIEPFLKYYLYKANIQPIISYSSYDAIKAEILDPHSALFLEKPDIIVLSLFYHPNDLFLHSQFNHLEDIKKDILSIFNLLKEKTSAVIVVNTLISPGFSTLVPYSEEIVGLSPHYPKINTFIKEYITDSLPQFILMDWEKYLQNLGESEALDDRYWYLNKAPFKKKFLQHYAYDISRLIKTLKGQLKKVLIVDCDNTLWGGIIGEDGIDGIKLDAYEYPGKIFYDFQQTILRLFNQGILIILCSKNNEEDVWQVLDSHPASLLKRKHIAAYKINWQDKATNIQQLATELNLGLDSFVFVDDNLSECDLVKQFLPAVTVFSVPKELYLLPKLLSDGIFDTVNKSEIDNDRTLHYQQETARRLSAKSYVNIEEYLQSLELKLDIHYTKESEFSRIAQLTQKTNQFNLGLKRYTEMDIRQFSNIEEMKVFSLWASDRYGHYGLTGTMIAHYLNNRVIFDSLLLSCRILSRRIEYAFMATCMQHLHYLWKVTHWQADFLLTHKNQQIKDFLITLGFKKQKETDNLHHYELQGMPIVPNIRFIHVNQLEPT